MGTAVQEERQPQPCGFAADSIETRSSAGAFSDAPVLKLNGLDGPRGAARSADAGSKNPIARFGVRARL